MTIVTKEFGDVVSCEENVCCDKLLVSCFTRILKISCMHSNHSGSEIIAQPLNHIPEHTNLAPAEKDLEKKYNKVFEDCFLS